MEQWEAVLYWSTVWEFEMLIPFAKDKMCAKGLPSGVELIRLGRKCEIPDWTNKGFQDLVTQTEPLSMGDALIISLSDLIAVATVREALLPAHCPGCTRSARCTAIKRSMNQNQKSRYDIAKQLSKHGIWSGALPTAAAAAVQIQGEESEED